MKKNPLEIQHLTTSDYKAAPFDKVILPLGSLESHGGHLPFGTDAITAHMIALDIAANVPGTAVLPAIPFGVSEHYKEFPFCISLQFETEIALIRDVLESIYREGIRKVFIMNGHDGNISPIEVAARSAMVRTGLQSCLSRCMVVLVGSLVPEGFFEVGTASVMAAKRDFICSNCSPNSVKCSMQKGLRQKLRPTWTSNGVSRAHQYRRLGRPHKRLGRKRQDYAEGPRRHCGEYSERT